MKTKAKQIGFTLIELMIVIAIIGIAITIGCNIITGQGGNVSYGLGGVVETRCIEGFKTNVGNGHTQQVLDENGHGIRCFN